MRLRRAGRPPLRHRDRYAKPEGDGVHAARPRGDALDTMAATMVAGEATIRYAESLGLADTSPLDEAFEGMRGDKKLQAFATISATPMAPGARPPAPWDDERDWFAVAGEDLEWLVRSETTSDCTWEAAETEIARRAARDADLLRPRALLRRTRWN